MRLRTKYTERLPTAPGLVLDIPVFEGSGSKVLDLSGKGNHGTITDAVWTRDENGVAMSFNGTSAYIVCGNDASLNITDTITIEAWVKPNGAIAVGYITAKGNPISARRYNLYWNGGADAISFWDMATERKSDTVFVDNNVRVHVALTINGTALSFYRNGIAAGTGTLTNVPVSNNDNVQIGDRVGGTTAATRFNGTIDEVRIYAVALTAEQIKRRYEQTKRDYVRAS